MPNSNFKTLALIFSLAVAIHANGAAPTSNTASTGQPAAAGEGGAGSSIRKSVKAMDIVGEWVGEIDCGKGTFDIRISFGPLAGGPQMVGAMAMLKPRPGSKLAAGAYSINGELKDGELRLRDGTWMQRSQSIPMLPMDATVYANPDRIAGRTLEAGCSEFELRRPGSLFAATVAATPESKAQGNPETVKPLTYRAVTKLIGDAKGNDRLIVASLVGKSVSLTLKATGPQALVVDPKDGVFFVCASRSPSFRSGAVVARVAAYETTPDGDVSISLDRCGS